MKAKVLLKRFFTAIVTALVVAQLLLVLVSWLLSAMMAGVHSLLSAEGIRWFVGNFTAMLSTPCLVWLLLLSMAGGCLWQSGLLSDYSAHAPARNYRQRIALRTSFTLLAAYVALLLLLTATPHAVLLSATGRLCSSPFSRAIVPLVAFVLSTVSAVYGRISGRFVSIVDIISSFSYGIGRAAPLFILYVVSVQFCESLRFAFSWTINQIGQ